MPLFGTRKKPKGPLLDKTCTLNVNMSGVSLSLAYPESNDWVYQKIEDLTGSINLYDTSNFEKEDDEPCSLSTCMLSRIYWVFQGLPFFSGDYIGRLGMAVSIFHMPTFTSLFKQRRFQCAMERYNYKTSVKNLSIESVSNYNQHTINGTDWANYESHTEDSTVFQTVWQTPITDEHLLTIRFSQDGDFNKSGLKAAFSKVIDLVMNNVKLELPNDIKTRKEEIERKFPYESLPKSLPPYEFEYYYPTNVLDLVRKVSAKYNHEITPDMQGNFDAEVSRLEELEKQKQQATHQKNLDHHMRFEQLEAEDRKRYLAEQEKT